MASFFTQHHPKTVQWQVQWQWRREKVVVLVAEHFLHQQHLRCQISVEDALHLLVLIVIDSILTIMGVVAEWYCSVRKVAGSNPTLAAT